MKNFIQLGDTLTFVAAGAIAGGAGLLLGTTGLFGVNSYDVVANDEGEAQIRGVFELPKASADAPAAFANAYWDDGNSRVTTADGSGANTLIGVFVKAYQNGDTLARVKLIPNVA